MASVEPTQVAKIVTRRLPRYPLPVALIGRLAIDRRAHGRRFGERLLVDAMRRVLAAADEVGCIGVIVDAKGEVAVRFYTKYDFASLGDEGWPRRLFIPLETIRAAFARA